MKLASLFLRSSFLLFITIFQLSSCSTKHTLFEKIEAGKSSIHFENKIVEKPGLSILDYLYFYNGGGVATGDINNDGLADIFFTANSKGNNKLYLNKGDFKFEDITEKAGVMGLSDWASGVTMADVNGDGFLDIYVATVSGRYGLKGHNELYVNNGNNTFTEKSAVYGLNTSCTSTQAAFFDYDQDGDLDCFLLNQSHHPHANIVDITKRKVYDSLSGDKFFRNDLATTGKFTDVSATAGIYQSSLGYGLGLAIADFNNDGWDDIYVGNDFHENDYYYLNNGKGGFVESGANHFKHYSRFSMGNDAADYNNDGQIDLVTVDMLPKEENFLKTYGSDENLDIYKLKLENNGYQNQFSKNALQRNNGSGESFSETSLLSGVSATDWSWSPLFADFDNDGNKDLFITSGIVKRPMDLDYIKYVSNLFAESSLKNDVNYNKKAIDAMPDGSAHPFFFKGDGKLSFEEVSDNWGTSKFKGYYTGAAYADFDNDGKLDVVVNCINEKALLLKNNAPQKEFINFTFKGNNNNTKGIGAKLYLFAKGKMQFQQVMSTRGFQSAVDPILHFGLGEKGTIDSVLIVWSNQQCQVLKGVQINRTIQLVQSNATKPFNYRYYFPEKKLPLQEVTEKININWSHHENTFIDFNKQYLIPHELSTQGPKITVADINNDGLDDFYVVGAAEQAGALFIQKKEGGFSETNHALFQLNSAAEEVAALFFDANNDGFKDLYVVSGGNQFIDGSPQLADKFYLNDGHGNFKDQTNASIPAILKNKSCISAADLDKDGDIDVFVGGLADASKYGIAQDAYLLLNNGKGVFSLAPKEMIQLDNLGIVTSSGISDINHDGWDDLIITGEWMPLEIFINHKGKFTKTSINSSTGLWQSIMIKDVNQDGFEDILAGNLGLNSKLSAGKQGPLKMYVKDFDKNGSIEQIITYTIKDKEYTFLAKDELERALPVLKKAFLKYDEVAGKTVQYMFGDLFKDYIALKAEELASSCFLNDGKGNFTKIALPLALQLAPIYTFISADNDHSFIGMGNLYGVIPYEGRYDALQPANFKFENGSFIVDHPNEITVNGEVRDAKWLKSAGNQQLLVIARNNQPLVFFQALK